MSEERIMGSELCLRNTASSLSAGSRGSQSEWNLPAKSEQRTIPNYFVKESNYRTVFIWKRFRRKFVCSLCLNYPPFW